MFDTGRVSARPRPEIPLAVLGERARPVTLAAERALPVTSVLAPLLPDGGLPRGATVGVHGPGATALALALVAAASGAGSWTAVVGADDLGLVAAAEAGLALERTVVVADPPPAAWSTVVARRTSIFQRPSSSTMPARMSTSLSTHSTRMPSSESGSPASGTGVLRGTSACSERGARIENMLPWPGRERTLSGWPSTLEMRWQIESPSPRPCASQLPGCSIRKNSSKICCRWYSGIPGPVSQTWSSTSPPRGRAASTTRPSRV